MLVARPLRQPFSKPGVPRATTGGRGNAERCETTPAYEPTPTPPRRNTDAKTSSRNDSLPCDLPPHLDHAADQPATHAIGMCRNFPYEVKAALKRRAGSGHWASALCLRPRQARARPGSQ
ncbi:hypothetical protein Cme02nite_22950 [Catellatospora methionotrophica]|uniref:Uncharacterized protein n=1 Tax=Catellatospora methionotrophica TaxID=121620 RepID=A0A8J3L967_9ACTN|nr:hypothetical protein Cme02nite_22950 [Catellatospora methionotrophica]